MNSVCAACGSALTPGDRFCRVCGRDSVPAPPSMGSSATAETSGKAIISLVCGLLFFIPAAFIAAIVFGHLALSEIRRSAGRLRGSGMAVAGLVLGYSWIVLIPIVLIIAAIAIPNLLRARIAANESAAVSSIRSINAAEVNYSANHPTAGYTCALADLAGDVGSDVVAGKKNGYTFELTGCSAQSEGGPNVTYQVVAYPVTRNQTGARTFCSDESAVIKAASSGSAQDCLQNGSTL